MARQIKFRAWNSIDKVMITDLNSPALWHGNLVPDGDDILMQYTGLKDKNGKEVYEGDIVRALDIADGSLSTGYPYITKIVFNTGNIEPDYTTGQMLAVDLDDSNYTGLHKVIVRSKGEVIGNIYEHPELLK